MAEVWSDERSAVARGVSATAVRSRTRLLAVGLFALLALLALSGSAQAAPATTVSLTFDDGRPSQMAAEQGLVDRGMKATYFIISSQVGLPGVMSLANLNALKADGMEIGAHTVLHRNLPTLSSDEAKRELCQSRAWLTDKGFDIYDMAYPYDETNASVELSAAACGYNSARAGSRLACDGTQACAETVPPLDAYALRTPNDFNSSTSLAQMKAAVTNAENNGGGWVPIEIHDVCDGPSDPLLPAGATCAPPYTGTLIASAFEPACASLTVLIAGGASGPLLMFDQQLDGSPFAPASS